MIVMFAPTSPTSAAINSVVLSDGCSVGPALCRRLNSIVGSSEIRPSPVLGNWDGLTDVCKGADTVYLLTALHLPPLPNDSDLQAFTTGVGRVLECCLECGVNNLVFTSSSGVVSSGEGLDIVSEDSSPYVTMKENGAAHAIAMAEGEVLKASGMHHVGGSSRLHTCALRPATIYGTEGDRPLHRALSWVAWGLNRLTMGPKEAKSDMVYVDNLIEAQVLAGAKLAEGPNAQGQAGGVGQNGAGDTEDAGPVPSGRAYFVTDGQPINLQAFMDGVLNGLDFPTSKILRVPTRVALVTAWLSTLLCKVGLPGQPVWTRAEVRKLTGNRTLSIARARMDLGYKATVDPKTAMRSTVDVLKRSGWGRHDVLAPSLVYWITNPLCVWLVTLAAYGGPCPAFLAPLASKAGYVGLLLVHQLSTVRAVCIGVYLIHVLEGVYAFRVAQKVGHRDTAPLWFLQTFYLGFPSITLVNKLKAG